MITLLKIPFKILALPFAAFFFLLTMLMRLLFLLMSTRIFVCISLLFAVGGILLLCQGSIYSGIGVIILAFLISPFGIQLFVEITIKIKERLISFIRE